MGADLRTLIHALGVALIRWRPIGILRREMPSRSHTHNAVLTTQEAADLLNVSRTTLVRLLTDGEIPLYTMRGRHRLIPLRDTLDYRDRTRHERRQALDQMAAEAEADGLYEATTPPKSIRYAGVSWGCGNTVAPLI